VADPLLARAEFLASLRKSKRVSLADLKLPSESAVEEKVATKKQHKTKLDQIHSDWSGNSDDEGSVESGVLEENICFECGKKINRKKVEELILCDICDADYHVKCVGLECAKRTRHCNYVCLRCLEDEKNFDDLNFGIDSTNPRFQVAIENFVLVLFCIMFLLSSQDSRSQKVNQE
jgi:hypothetical protein